MSRKDFNKGMEAGARPFEDKFRRMGKEFQEFAGKVEEDVSRIRETNEAILDEMDVMQKKQFYRDNTAVDIAILEKGDRETLLALLHTLAETEETVNDHQQRFIRSVKRSLEKDNDRRPENWAVLKDEDWSVIETLDGIEETKAIAQAVMEFLFLGYRSHDAYFEEYEDMFDCFCLNRKGFGEIMAHIDNIFRATGLEGIAENYGYVPEETEEERDTCYGASTDLLEEIIAERIRITEGEEKIFENKKLVFSTGIYMEGNAKLVFRNCHILYDEMAVDDERILVDGASTIMFENCTIEWKNESSFISIAQTGKAKVIVQGCILNECACFLSGNSDTSTTIRNTEIRLAAQNESHDFIETHELCIEDSIFDMETGGEFTDIFDDGTTLFRGDKNHKHHIKRCSFNNLKRYNLNAKSVICDSNFDNCFIKTMAVYEDGNSAGTLNNCTFRNCIFMMEHTPYSKEEVMEFENVEMIECAGELPAAYLKNVKADGGYLMIQIALPIKMENCCFSNWSYEKYKNVEDYKGEKIFTDYKETHYITTCDNRLTIAAIGSCEISDCTFENLQVGQTHLIGGIERGGRASYKISNSQFVNICTDSGSILRKSNKYEESYGMFGRKSRTVTETTEMNIQNCKGL